MGHAATMGTVAAHVAPAGAAKTKDGDESVPADSNTDLGADATLRLASTDTEGEVVAHVAASPLVSPAAGKTPSHRPAHPVTTPTAKQASFIVTISHFESRTPTFPPRPGST